MMVENSPSQVARALLELLASPPMRLELQHNARMFAQRYDWLAVGSQFIDLYHTVIHANS
jgi:glycosyltransferase involved in cell wall biosynthesis